MTDNTRTAHPMTTTSNQFDHAIGDNINELLDALQDVRPGVWVDREPHGIRDVPTDCVRLIEAQIASELLGRRAMLLELDRLIPSVGERSLLDDILANSWPSDSDSMNSDSPSCQPKRYRDLNDSADSADRTQPTANASVISIQSNL